ncbi:hypothetical protein HO133_006024 [Letharia lupina]|uniref:BTB domain transcription factor n=1 Tax=Letharia lupina TaxID=560253 RepID=A0A8H6F8I1_9LECA|nr:uncharacterized protein HO133_006024 [Letharia lupina]KAF6218673.1 hypothetical protein HO133_006024 [Letharia lupina]
MDFGKLPQVLSSDRSNWKFFRSIIALFPFSVVDTRGLLSYIRNSATPFTRSIALTQTRFAQPNFTFNMAGTRRSTRQAATKPNPSEASSKSKPAAAAGTKRKAESEAPAKGKRGKKGAKKEQTTIEASMPSDDKNGDSKEDVEMKDEQEAEPAEASNGKTGADEVAQREEEVRDQEPMDEEKKEEPSAEKKEPETNGDAKENSEEEPKKNGFDALMDHTDKDEDKNVTEEGTGSKVSKAEDAVEDSSKREEATPSSILEKGIIYFFFRGRVGINEPTDVNDIARSYIVLRPVPHGAKLGDGPIGDAGNNRMLALPKKVLPVSPKDRFMTFVEKANISMDDIKSQLSSSDYATKTAGARHTPAATPIGEGVYAITQTGRETHLAYILTIPSELGEIQQGVGLRQRGSYITSAKNPQSSGPANANLPQGAEYPKEILDEFHGRGWMPLQPKLLNYENTQFLLIGHNDDALEKAAKPQDGEEEKPEKETPLEEMETLEHEDEIRVEHLKGE